MERIGIMGKIEADALAGGGGEKARAGAFGLF